jgi:hypothetical protein
VLATWALAASCAPGGASEGTLGSATPALEVAARARPSVLSRVAVIGASASRGFALPVGLADALSALSASALLDVQDCSSSRMFLAPLTQGNQQVECAREGSPTLVIALDFLFWFGYGFAESEAQRLERLEQGLELLEDLDGHLVVGRFPDMSAAVGRMLLPGQMPDGATLERLNARLAEWARGRDVLVLPLDRMLADLRAGRAVDLGGEAEAHGTGNLLQADELHPTLEGELFLARAVLTALSDAGHAIGPLVEHGSALEALEERAAARTSRRDRRE